MLDRGDIAMGGGADGEGELVPPPLSPTLQIPYFPGSSRPARAFGKGYPYTSAGIPHPTRALWQRIPVYLAGIPTSPAHSRQ